MSRVWSLEESHGGMAVPARAVSALLEAVVSPSSADAMLGAVQAVVPVDYLSLVDIHHELPRLVEGSAARPQERSVVSQCFAIYRRHYYRRDTILPLAAQLLSRPSPGCVAVHCRADELPDSGWRADIYERERLTDRFTLLHSPSAGVVQAIHLYRDERRGAIGQQEIEHLLGFAPLLRQAQAAAWRTAAAARQDRERRVSEAERRLQRLVPALSPREGAVCARIAQGQSADGIAAELDVAPSTVVTLRKRAYLKLADAGFPAHRIALARMLG